MCACSVTVVILGHLNRPFYFRIYLLTGTRRREHVHVMLIWQVYSLFDDASDDVTTRRTLTACLRLIAYTNCAVNPLIYSLLNERFKATVKSLPTTVKQWGSHRDTAGHLATGRSRVAMVAGPPLRLGVMLAREPAMTVDRPAGRRDQGADGD